MNTSISSSFADDTNAKGDLVNKHKSVHNSGALQRAVLLGITALCFAAGSHAAEAPVKKAATATVAKSVKADPLQGDTWHAVNGTWPGTLVFDGKAKRVDLTPVGAQAIRATYEITKLDKKGAESKGSLRMVSADGKQVVTAAFTLTGTKQLTLRYSEGQRDEQYERMTAAEEEAEKARFKRLLEEKQKGVTPLFPAR